MVDVGEFLCDESSLLPEAVCQVDVPRDPQVNFWVGSPQVQEALSDSHHFELATLLHMFLLQQPGCLSSNKNGWGLD